MLIRKDGDAPEGDGYIGVYCSGPSHNYLKLRLRRGGGGARFPVTVLPPIGACRHHDGLTAEETAPAIAAGLASANETLGADFAVVSAEIVENDSRRPDIYRVLARRIVLAAAEEEAPQP